MFLPAHVSVRSLNITGNPKYTVTSQRAIYIQVTQALHVPHSAIEHRPINKLLKIVYILKSMWQHQVIIQ